MPSNVSSSLPTLDDGHGDSDDDSDFTSDEDDDEDYSNYAPTKSRQGAASSMTSATPS